MHNKLNTPEGWKISTLEEIIIDAKIGIVRSAKDQKLNGIGFPYIKMNNIDTDGNVNLSKDIVYVQVSEDEISKFKLLKGDLLLNTRNSFELVGKTGIVKDASIPRVYNNNLLRLRFKEHIDSRFINYLINSPIFKRLLLRGKKATTNICALYQKDLFPLPIIFPPLTEQQEIVAKIEELFSELDKGKEQLETARQQLKVYRKAVLKWAFEGKFTNAVVKNGELPEGWKWVKMGEVIEKPKYGTSKKCDYNFVGKAVLRIPNIGDGNINATDLKFASFEEVEVESYRLHEGDLLTIRSNGSVDLVGKCALITKKDEEFLYAGYLIRLRPLHNKINSRYLLHNLSSSYLRNQIENKAKSTSGVNNINTDELKSLILPLPPLEEQIQIVQEIESRLSVCDKMEETIWQSLQQAETLRQSILKQAFEGKLVGIPTPELI